VLGSDLVKKQPAKIVLLITMTYQCQYQEKRIIVFFVEAAGGGGLLCISTKLAHKYDEYIPCQY
jgi:hypothetical protein